MAKLKFILALDQGTTSSRAIVFDSNSRIVAVGQREFTRFSPGPVGWNTIRRSFGKRNWQRQDKRFGRPI